MNVRFRRALLGGLLLTYPFVSSGAVKDREYGACFDFEKVVSQPLMPPPKLTGDGPVFIEGEEENGIFWGGGRAIVPLEFDELYSWLLDHTNWKDPNKTKIQVEGLRSKNYLQLHRMEVNLRPFLFISLDWTEEWGYRLLKGTPKKPQEILVSYQKTKGTSHISHLCGSVLFSRVKNGTDVFLYEESKADHYSKEGIVKMIQEFLERFKKMSEKKPESEKKS